MSLIKRYVPASGLENIFIHFQFRWSLDKYEELLEFRFIKQIKGKTDHSLCCYSTSSKKKVDLWDFNVVNSNE